MTSLVTAAEFDSETSMLKARVTALEAGLTNFLAEYEIDKSTTNTRFETLRTEVDDLLVGNRTVLLPQPVNIRDFATVSTFGSWSNFNLAAQWASLGLSFQPKAVILQVSSKITYLGGLEGGDGSRFFDIEFSGLASQTNPLSSGITNNPPARRVWVSGRKDDSVFTNSDCATLTCPIWMNTNVPTIRVYYGGNGGSVSREVGIQITGWMY